MRTTVCVVSLHCVTGLGPKSTSRAMLVAFVAVLALLGAACGGDDTAATAGASDAATAAGVAPIAGGGQIDFGDLEGSPAMLWFWAPW